VTTSPSHWTKVWHAHDLPSTPQLFRPASGHRPGRGRPFPVRRPGTRCIVLCSEGRSFCAGANFGGAKKTGRAVCGGGTGTGRAPRTHVRGGGHALQCRGADRGCGARRSDRRRSGLAMACDFRVATLVPGSWPTSPRWDPPWLRALGDLAQGGRQPTGRAHASDRRPVSGEEAVAIGSVTCWFPKRI